MGKLTLVPARTSGPVRGRIVGAQGSRRAARVLDGAELLDVGCDGRFRAVIGPAAPSKPGRSRGAAFSRQGRRAARTKSKGHSRCLYRPCGPT
eukprot:scaffold6348_cov117-Isochrysis_galbana.AAC.3